MATKITSEVLESYLHCKVKGHLKLAGQQGTRSDYELLLAESRDEVARRATDKILAHHSKEEVERDVGLTKAALKRGAAFLLNDTLEDELDSLAFVGLQRVPGPSKLGDFHYVPVLNDLKLSRIFFGAYLLTQDGAGPLHERELLGPALADARLRAARPLRVDYQGG